MNTNNNETRTCNLLPGEVIRLIKKNQLLWSELNRSQQRDVVRYIANEYVSNLVIAMEISKLTKSEITVLDRPVNYSTILNKNGKPVIIIFNSRKFV